MGVRRIALAAKWPSDLMDRASAYFTDGGLNVVGMTWDAHTSQGTLKLGPNEGYESAMRLGRRAMIEAPNADALFLGGGAWPDLAALIDLEREFDRPVITNPIATFWDFLRGAELAPQSGDLGKLIGTLRK